MFCVSTFLMPLVWQLVIYRLLCIGIFYLARPFCNGSFDALCIASPSLFQYLVQAVPSHWAQPSMST